jgi:NAD(P)H dehydrogenase (quinone)
MQQARSVTVAIVYHSGYGHTHRQAQAVAQGAESVPGTTVRLLATADVEGDLGLLDSADAIIFGTPTYMGSPSAGFKAFMEASSKVWADNMRWRDKLAAGFTSSQCMNGDKLNTLMSLALFAAQHGMQWVGLDLYGGWNSSAGSPEDLNRLGSWLGAMAQCDAGTSAVEAPPSSDLRTAAYLGQRVASLAWQWAAGRALAQDREAALVER